MRKIIILLCAALLLFSGCGKAGQKEELLVYTGMDTAYMIRIAEQFERDTGIRISFQRKSNHEILQSLEDREEAFDIWYGGSSILMEDAKQQELLLPYISEKREEIDEKYKDEEGYWTGISVGVLAIVINRQWHLEQGVSNPGRWSDLQRVEYKNWLTLPSPESTEAGYLTIALFNELYGELRTRSVLQNINQNVTEYTLAEDSTGRFIGYKESAATIMFAHDAMRLKNEGFNELNIIYPTEPTTYEVGAIAMTATVQNEEAAQQFIDWSLTKEAQEIGQRIGSYHMLTNVNAVNPVQSVSLDELLIMPVDEKKAVENRSDIISNFKEVIKYRE
ncbi:extracellular solute-binding protein [Oceanobacillus sp. CFH 90083]|uniref:extracellular solute-binding protein n=1 Tax=Oceanobacillus sp. CFH 90083 TaxID=2592336 RepID=UPI00128CD6C9|nr:extracellular solute-binding protein [Oceanobacillus sp. CFH 90083]